MRTSQTESLTSDRAVRLPVAVRIAWFCGALVFFMTCGIPMPGPLAVAAFVAAIGSVVSKLSVEVDGRPGARAAGRPDRYRGRY
jgi:hypothetical protein